jgi:hypothetical protein
MKLKVLAMVSQDRHVQVDALLDRIGEEVNLKVLKLPDEKTTDLSGVLHSAEIEKFDRTLLLLKFRHIRTQAATLRSMPGLVLHETDACQDRIPESRLFGAFTNFYQKLPAFKLVCTGYTLSKYFSSKGIDAYFVAKGADTAALTDLGLSRDIELGFIGKMIQGVYKPRTQMIQKLQEKQGLQTFRTEGIEEYRNGLNRIRIFVSADIGLGEYMYKNFEAMACGCLLMAYRQGEGEEEALGFQDMQNVVLYDNEDEFSQKLSWIRSHPDEVERIRLAGNQHVRTRWSFVQTGEQIAEILQMQVKPNASYRGSWWRRLLSH